MAFDDHSPNFAYSLVATAPSPAASGTSLVVTAGQGALFPTPPFNATVWPVGVQPLTTNAEIVRVTAISTDTLTITRAQESTVARSIIVGDQIAATITAKIFTDIETADLGQFGATTSAQLASVITNETGSGALVFGTSPTFTTQITTPLITGGSGATDYFSMSSNTNTPNTVSIKSNSAIDLLPTGITRTASGLRWGVEWTSTITNDYSSNTLPRAVNFAPTVSLNQSSSGLAFATVFANQAIIQNVSGVNATWGPLFVLLSGSTFRADAANIISTSGMQDIRIAPTFTTVNSGTLHQAAHYGVWNTGVVSGDARLGERIGYYMGAVTVSGNGIIHNNIGFLAADMTEGRDFNYAIKTGTGRHSFGDHIEVATGKSLIMRDSNGSRYILDPPSDGVDANWTIVAYDPYVDTSWLALYDPIAANVGSVADGADVTRWADRSGNAYDLTIGGGTDVPIWEDSNATLNNQPAVRFASASSQSLEATNTILFTAATGYTIIAVVDLNAVTAIMKILGHNAGNNNRGFGTTATPQWTTQMGTTAASGGTPAANTKYFVRVYATSSAHTIYVNEVSQATTATAAVNVNQIVVGAGKNSSDVYTAFADMDLGWLSFYAGDFSASGQWSRFKTYANTRWGFAL